MQDAWIDAFEESLAHARGSSPHTVKAYLTDARAFARYLEGAGKDLVSADHGNFEQMVADDGQPHTQHTVGPVPLVYLGRKATLAHGALRDLAPTVLALMGLAQPAEMTGHSLVTFG